MYTGSCLCRKVKFQISGTIDSIIFCHCSQCRKAQGSAFGANGFVNQKDFKFVSGESYLSAYESSPGKVRCFCKTCGSPIISKRDSDPEKLRVRLGTLDTDILERPTGHIFVSDKVNWFEVNDDLPKYERYESSR